MSQYAPFTSRTVIGRWRWRRPGDESGEIVAAVRQVGLHDDARLELGELWLAQQLAEQLQREVLRVVVLHVEVHERPAFAGEAQQRPDAALGLLEHRPRAPSGS